MIKRIYGLIALAQIFITGGAQAADPVTMYVNGKVVAAPCQVDSASVEQVVDLFGPQGIRASSMYMPGSGSPFVMFNFSVINCPAGTVQTTLRFSGPADDSQPENSYKNSGTAKNVAVQLLNMQGGPLGNNKTLTGNIINRQATFYFLARAFSKYGKATPGTVNSVVVITLTWQ